ncbi:MAG: 1-(5-phosphoribosyl)-5-((5-phosphoribosylamino)methylideneamino)imidazole-4-carboxamide isomerase, partial [Armatimonadota bacterium]
MLILPAIDIRDGKAVRLHQGKFEEETVYSDDPVRVAEAFYAAGARWIHIVDLDGARNGIPAHLDLVRAITSHRDLHVQMGGGVRSLATIEEMLASGVRRVVLGTALVRDPELTREAFFAFPTEVVAGLDCRE